LRDIRLEVTPDQLPPDDQVETNKLPLFDGMAMAESSLAPEEANLPEKDVVLSDKIQAATDDDPKLALPAQAFERGGSVTELVFAQQKNARANTSDPDRLFSAILGKSDQATERDSSGDSDVSGELSKEMPVSDLFRRLSQGSPKPQAQTPAPSFFRKIFGS